MKLSGCTLHQGRQMNILHGKRILIVEDDALSRLVFRLILTKAGATIEFNSGGNAPSLFERRVSVDLILLDLKLTRGQCGYALYQLIRAIPEFRHTPIVAVSAEDPDSVRVRTRTLGFQGFIAKPIDADGLPRDLAHVLAGNDLWVGGPPLSMPFEPQEVEVSLPLHTGSLRRPHHGTGFLVRPPRS